MKAAPSRRDRLRAMLADLKMPGSLEALDPILQGVDGGALTAAEAIETLLGAQIQLRNHRRLQAAGYTGSYSRVRDYVRRVRPRPAPEPPHRFETPPGKQAQVDFAEFHLPWGKRYALVVVLGHSRYKWFRFFKRQDMRTLFRGLEEAFHVFGGVPEELLFDQMRAVITKDLRLLGGQLVVNEEFLRFAAH